MASPPARKRRGGLRRRLIWLAVLAMVGTLAVAGAALAWLQSEGITPRSLAPYLTRRAQGHNAVITGVTGQVSAWMQRMDRGDALPPPSLQTRIGAQPEAAGTEAALWHTEVASSQALLAAIAAARPGETITILPGNYLMELSIKVQRPGNPGQPITVRARKPGSVTLAFRGTEGFKVSVPHWRFENLIIRGVCSSHSDCEHAFHVTGGGQHFAALNNTLIDFNAHFKINPSDGRFPDHGLIEGNTLRNASVRDTLHPVTPVDLVAASGWVIRRNYIADFIKGNGDKVSYGAFVKGAGSKNLMEGNLVICEDRLRGAPGQRVGLSLGGGGTDKQSCRDSRCITEQNDSTIRANLVASCSDAGIYINNSAHSTVQHNTLVDTSGILARFAGSSADVAGNLVDGPILARNSALLRLDDNLSSGVARMYLGGHPNRELFRDALGFDFAWANAAPRRVPQQQPAPDLCGAVRPAALRYGAFEDFSACLRPR